MSEAGRFLARVGAIASKELLHIRRDPRTLYLALVMPVVMLLLFGFGISFDSDHLPVAVVDLDGSRESRALVTAFTASGELEAIVPLASHAEAEAERLLRTGRALGVLTLPSRTGRALARGEQVELQLTVDGADGTVANQLLAKASALARAASARLSGAAGRGTPLEVKLLTRFNPTMRSALFFVPGLTAYLLAISAVLLTALAIAGEWERGSMEQLFASPVSGLEIILGKLLPYLGLGFLQLLLVLAVGTWAFDVPVRGSLGLVFAAGLLFLVGMLGQGLLISVVTRSQLLATQAGALSSLLPSMLLSGFVFPIENMPRVLQWLSAIVPARYLVAALRALMLKGAGFREIRLDLLALEIFAVAVLTLSTVRFRRKLA